MTETLSWADGRKRITGIVIEISTSEKRGGHGRTSDRIIADALFPAGTVPPAAGTRLIADWSGKLPGGTVIKAEKIAGNRAFVRIRITAG